MRAITLHLGLDVHKDCITIAIAQPGPKGEIRPFGTITHDLHALEKALTRIRKAHPGAHLEVAYEASPCGFGIARRLQQLKVLCLVAAPSLIAGSAPSRSATARSRWRPSPHPSPAAGAHHGNVFLEPPPGPVRYLLDSGCLRVSRRAALTLNG